MYTHVVYEVLKGTTEEGGMYDNDIYVCTYKCSNYNVGDGGLYSSLSLLPGPQMDLTLLQSFSLA